MIKLTLFCTPGNVYRGRTEREVAEAYTRMGTHDFDELIGFEPEYAANFVQTPDYKRRIGEKEGRRLDITVFAQQPVVSVGGVPVSITSSSNIFTPECSLQKDGETLYLPDLEVIEMEGSLRDVDKILHGIMKLYVERNGWKVHQHSSPVRKSPVRADSKRFTGSIEILDPEILLEIARREAGYSPDRLCFSP